MERNGLDCIDLKDRFGREFRITWDPAAGERSADPWMMTMPCRKGEIYPHGGISSPSR
jgi:hypothetical protein